MGTIYKKNDPDAWKLSWIKPQRQDPLVQEVNKGSGGGKGSA